MMTTHQQEKQPADRERHEREQRDAVIGAHVLRAVGRPGDLQRVQVRLLWEGRYRVNIFVGLDAASARVAHSFFLVIDGDGAIVASTPRITRRYEVSGEGETLSPPR